MENNWISVKDRLPYDGQRVLTYCPNAVKTYEVANIVYNESWSHSVACEEWDVTHWIPFPEFAKNQY